MTAKPVILIDILREITSSMNIPVNFQPGRSSQILKSLTDLDNSVNFKGEKYPLVAMVLPVPIHRGITAIYYGAVNIRRIIFAQIVSWDGTESVLERYQDTGVIKSILYPAYYEFMNRVAWHPNIIGSDPYMFEHDLIENPGTQPIGEGLNDYVDTLEIVNLKLTLSQIKTC